VIDGSDAFHVFAIAKTRKCQQEDEKNRVGPAQCFDRTD
jgi:hypothetical protein